MSELTIRDMEQDEDFAAWFSEILEQEEDPAGWSSALDERYLILSNEIGDWIGASGSGSGEGLPTWLMWSSCPRSATGATPTACCPHSSNAPSSPAPIWRSSGPTTPAPRDCWPPWAGAASSYETVTWDAAPGP